MLVALADRYRWWWLHEGFVHVWHQESRMWLPPPVSGPLGADLFGYARFPHFCGSLTGAEVREQVPLPGHRAWDHPLAPPPTHLLPWWTHPPAEVELLGLNPNPQPAVRTWRFK